ncbi:hypothetical protein HGA91_05485 [candidate division WWE3 bacterium]|nr:hypothetical protein [candidate division WWE3 bacterium]
MLTARPKVKTGAVVRISTVSMEVVAGQINIARDFGEKVLGLTEDPTRREINGSDAILMCSSWGHIRFVDPLLPAQRNVSEYGIVFDVEDIDEVLAQIAAWCAGHRLEESVDADDDDAGDFEDLLAGMEESVTGVQLEVIIETSEPGVVEVFIPGLFHAPIGFKQVTA